ncbi:NUDIX hydrolase [Patescibacteria group bacterium]|nr:NUDIX hydrolase [Patescibacteria group bacterium]
MKKDRPYRKSTVPESAKLVFEGQIFDVHQWEQTLYDGTIHTFEKVARQDTAVIYPILEDGRILLIKDSQPQRDTVITAPSGRLESGEYPEAAIVRELLEETGYKPETLVPFYVHQPYEKIDWFVHVFIGKNCKKVQEPKVDPGEKIELMPVTYGELIQLVLSESIRQEGLNNLVLRALLDSKKAEELKKLFSN